MIPVDRIEEKKFNDTFLMYPFIVSISRNWSSANSLTGIMEVILSPSDKHKIWHENENYNNLLKQLEQKTKQKI